MKLPKHWQMAELQNLILTKKGKKPEKLSHIPFANSVPYLDIEAVEKNSVRQFANSENSVLSDENDLFIVWDGSRSGLIAKGKKGIVGSTLMCITPIISKDYLFYFLQSQYENFNQTTTGTSIPHVNSEFFNTLNVPIAPLKEQTQIVSILDEIFEKFETAKKQLAKVPRLLERYRQSVLELAVSGELTEDWREENNVEFNWENKSVKNISNSIHYGFTAKAESKNTGIKLLRITDIQKNAVDWDNVPFCEISPNLVNTYLLEEGDLLFARIGATVGKSFLIPSVVPKCVFASYLIRIKLKNLVNKNFIYLFFKSSNYWKQINSNIDDSILPVVNGTKLGNILIAIPSLPEQTEIVNRVEKLLKKADEAEAKYQAAMKMIDKLQASVLAMAFRGELSEPQPNDEPVSELLEKIKTEKARLEQERKEIQKSQSQKRRNMGKTKNKKEKKSILEILKNSSVEELTVEECYRESGQPTPAAFFKDLRKNLADLDIQKSFDKPEGEVKIKLKAQ